MWWFAIVTAGYLVALGFIWWATPQAPDLARKVSPLASLLMVAQIGFNAVLVFAADISPPLIVLVGYLAGQGLIVACAIVGTIILAKAGLKERTLLAQLVMMYRDVEEIRDQVRDKEDRP